MTLNLMFYNDFPSEADSNFSLFQSNLLFVMVHYRAQRILNTTAQCSCIYCRKNSNHTNCEQMLLLLSTDRLVYFFTKFEQTTGFEQ